MIILAIWMGIFLFDFQPLHGPLAFVWFDFILGLPLGVYWFGMYQVLNSSILEPCWLLLALDYKPCCITYQQDFLFGYFGLQRGS